METGTKGTVRAISICQQRGELKKEVQDVLVVAESGIQGDGHSGDWDRQVTCLSWESVLRSNREHGLDMGPGDFAENILIQGLDLSQAKGGDRLKLGDQVVLSVSQVGKEDHPSVVTRTFGVSLLPHEGLFCRVEVGGALKKGDRVEFL